MGESKLTLRLLVRLLVNLFQQRHLLAALLRRFDLRFEEAELVPTDHRRPPQYEETQQTQTVGQLDGEIAAAGIERHCGVLLFLPSKLARVRTVRNVPSSRSNLTTFHYFLPTSLAAARWTSAVVSRCAFLGIWPLGETFFVKRVSRAGRYLKKLQTDIVRPLAKP